MFVHSTAPFGSYPEPGHQSHRDHGRRHARSGRATRSTRDRRRRRQLFVLIGGLSVLLGGAAAFAGPIARSINYKTVNSLTVQQIGVSSSNPAVGEIVRAGVKVVAAQDRTYDEVRIAARDQNGRRADFPSVANWQVGTSQKEYTAERSFDTPGIYTYWFAVRKGTKWMSVQPKQSFKVGDGVSPGTSPTPGPTATPIPEPSGSPTGTPSTPGSTTAPGTSTSTNPPTTQPTTSPTVAPPPPGNNGRGCPAFPAMPDASCTGVPVGTALKACSNTLNVAGATYDGCLFSGSISVQANNITIKNSKIAGGRVDTGYGAQTGLVLMDVEIDGENRDPNNQSAIGPDNYTCIRCNVWRTGRGAAMNNNVTLRDSWFHDFFYTSGAHQTAAQSNGGSNFQVIHNNLECRSGGCSSALSLYGDFSPINNVLVQNNLFNTSGSYCTYGGSVSVKPYPNATNVRYIDNLFGKKYFSICGIYGPYTAWAWNTGNVWSGNRWQDGSGSVG